MPDGTARPDNADDIVYPLDTLSIPVHVILSETDQACPFDANLKRYENVPFLTTETLIDGQDHIGMLSNDADFLGYLYAAMPQTQMPVDDPLLCPIVPIPPEPEPEVEAVPSCQLNFLDDYVPRRSRSRTKKLRGFRSGSGSSNKSSSSSGSYKSYKSSSGSKDKYLGRRRSGSKDKYGRSGSKDKYGKWGRHLDNAAQEGEQYWIDQSSDINDYFERKRYWKKNKDRKAKWGSKDKALRGGSPGKTKKRSGSLEKYYNRDDFEVQGECTGK